MICQHLRLATAKMWGHGNLCRCLRPSNMLALASANHHKDTIIMKSMIEPIYKYRRFIVRSARNELRDRYAGSGIGIFWNVILPLVQIAIYAIVFSTLMGPRVSATGSAANKYAFVLYLCAGILPWIAFSECIGRGTQSLVRNARYLQKMALPEAIFVAQSTVEGIFTAAISLTLFVSIGWLLGLPVGWSYL